MDVTNGKPATVDGVGEFLRRERELRHITLDDVAERTKIGRRYLEAIEEGRYDRLPGETFVRGFIRSYAQSVGLDPADTLLLYDQARGLPDNAPPLTQRQSPAQQHRRGRSLHGLLAAAVVAMSLGLLGVIAAFEGPTLLRRLATLGAGSDRTVANSTPLVLTVIADADTWVWVSIDQQEAQDLLLRAGQSAKWMGQDQFLLSIGNAQATRLRLNGRDLSMPPTSQSILRRYPVSRDMLR